ncbi:MAG: B12-binding domain-containing radical SAM protein [Candidatus Nanoarchaeia archaeon]|nr:B12-binding domain-containing radical SAM protein [Candidatus Nanoarchaeia archaeon]
MKPILLVYPPFCTPASPPYSAAKLYSALKANSIDAKALDLNIEFHKRKYPVFQEYFQSFQKQYEKYAEVSADYLRTTKADYALNNKMVASGKNPELFDEMMELILKEKPSFVAFSIVYSSQAFYAFALLKALKEKGIKTVIGGPAVNSVLKGIADFHLNNEAELLAFCGKNENAKESPIDFSEFNLKDYFTPSAVLPIKTSSACYYQQCAFCTHHNKSRYAEFSLSSIVETIRNSKQKYIFLIDDMISKKRILEIAAAFKPLKISWMCQLKPTKEYDAETFKTLYESGLKAVVWGVESGSDRILKLMKKQTNAKDIEGVLKAAHDNGIKNGCYIMFGFPTETKEEFLETIEFLKRNSENIDLVSISIFGLQKGTEVYDNPSAFGIIKIIETERKMLEPSIKYDVSRGLSQEESKELRKNYKKTLDKLNKYPKAMNFFREHLLVST